MATPKKNETKRRNAGSSTGPRTRGGKDRARMNARNHGLRCHEVLLPGEDPDEFEAFREDLSRDLGPVGMLESELADQVVSSCWWLRRCERIGAGLLGGGSHVMDMIASKKPEEFVEMLRYNQDLENLNDVQIFGRFLILLAEDYRRKILDRHNIAIVRDNDLADLYKKAILSDVNVRGADTILDKEILDVFLKVVAIEQQRNPLTYDVALAFQKDLLEQEGLAKLARYETTHRRAFHRGLQELHRLQDRRRKTPTSRPDVIDVDPSGGSE